MPAWIHNSTLMEVSCNCSDRNYNVSRSRCKIKLPTSLSLKKVPFKLEHNDTECNMYYCCMNWVLASQTSYHDNSLYSNCCDLNKPLSIAISFHNIYVIRLRIGSLYMTLDIQIMMMRQHTVNLKKHCVGEHGISFMLKTYIYSE